MTTPTHPFPSTLVSPDDRIPLRLHLERTMGDGALDGSWWPQSRDLAVELADLVDHFPTEHGRVQRVVFSRPDWDTAPHRVRVARGLVKVGSYPRDDTRQVWLSMSTHVLIRLAVRASEDSVAPEMREGAAPLEPVAADESQLAAEYWTDDGGAWWDPQPVAPSKRM